MTDGEEEHERIKAEIAADQAWWAKESARVSHNVLAEFLRDLSDEEMEYVQAALERDIEEQRKRLTENDR